MFRSRNSFRQKDFQKKKKRERCLPYLLCPAEQKQPFIRRLFRYFSAERFSDGLFLYLLGISVAVIFLCIRNVFGEKNAAEPYISELPLYRLPTFSDLFSRIFLRIRDFISKAFGIILLSSVAVWALTNFDFSLCPAPAEESMLAAIGKAVSPLFFFCGFFSWQATAAIISGFLSKESVVATLFVLTGKTGGLTSVFPSPLSAMSFLIFILLYPPCVASLSALKRETGFSAPRLPCFFSLRRHCLSPRRSTAFPHFFHNGKEIKNAGLCYF